MKNLIRNRPESGSVLLVGLVTCALLGIGLASYLVLTQTQHLSVIRSQGWNSAMPIAEAGAEEALAHINRGVPYFDARDSTNNLATNGWVYNSSTGKYHSPRRYLGEDYYEVSIQLSAGIPLIRSTGFVFMASSYSYAPQSHFAAIGVDQPQSAKYRPRKVRVETKTDPLFNVAMAALRLIDFNGKNIGTDSFDSADPNYSDNGLYPIGNVNKTKDNGDVVTDFTIVNSLSVGNAKIKGQVKTGPDGTITIGPNGSVGDRAWVEGGNTGIQTGHSANDMNVAFPSVVLPSTTWMPASSGNTTIDGITYDYVFNTDGNYTISSFNKGIYVGTNKTVRLKITSSVNMNGNDDAIRIASGGKLTMFMVGSSFKIAGNGVINDSGDALNFAYYGLPSNTSVNFQGNAAFTGTIYAPEADFHLGGGGNNTYDFVGASVSKSVTMNGHFNFHYDENLRRLGPSRGWIPKSWTERSTTD